MRTTAPLVALLAPVAVVVVALVGGCSSAPPNTADYVADGHYGIGVHTFTFVDTTRATPPNKSYPGAPSRTLVVEVWYPSSQEGGPFTDPPAAKGAFPLVLHSHGFMDGRRGEGYLGEHLASRGYIVAAPDYPLSNGGAPGGSTITDTAQQPLDARFVIDQLLAQSADAGSPLAGAIDSQRIAASGLSLGGLTTLLLAQHPTSRDPRLKAALAIAPPSCMFTAPFFAGATVPLLFLHGESDMIVPLAQNSARAYPLSQAPSELVVLKNGSHTGFAGPAALLDQSMHLDRLGCSAISGATDVSSFATLGTEAQGISADPNVCPMPCTSEPVDPALDAERQQALTKAVAQAFFDAHLAADRDAETFVQTRIDKENSEVLVTYKK
jgi:predicted dienelactone hydrolase